ncbi:MAG: hypothetical protein R2788_27035 [Saprospiraceae bacterium]
MRWSICNYPDIETENNGLLTYDRKVTKMGISIIKMAPWATALAFLKTTQGFCKKHNGQASYASHAHPIFIE